MTKETLIKSMFLLAKSFKDFQAHQDKATVDIWYDVFKEEDDLLFQSAIKVCIVTFEYSNPKISNINKFLADVKNPNKQDPGDIYEEIQNAIRYQKNVNDLTCITQKVIKGMGGLNRLGLSTSQDFDRTQILKMATTYLERHTEELLLTNTLKKEQLENKSRILQLTEKIGN